MGEGKQECAMPAGPAKSKTSGCRMAQTGPRLYASLQHFHDGLDNLA